MQTGRRRVMGKRDSVNRMEKTGDEIARGRRRRGGGQGHAKRAKAHTDNIGIRYNTQIGV